MLVTLIPLDGQRLKQLEADHTQMQRIIARQTLEFHAMRNLIAKNGWGLQRGKTR